MNTNTMRRKLIAARVNTCNMSPEDIKAQYALLIDDEKEYKNLDIKLAATTRKTPAKKRTSKPKAATIESKETLYSLVNGDNPVVDFYGQRLAAHGNFEVYFTRGKKYIVHDLAQSLTHVCETDAHVRGIVGYDEDGLKILTLANIGVGIFVE